MNKNRWITGAFLLFSALMCSFFLFKGIFVYILYSNLSEKKPVEIHRWWVEEKGDQMFLCASFSSIEPSFSQKVYHHQFSEIYPNRLAALLGLKEKSKKDFFGWYSIDKRITPTLERAISYRSFIYAGISGMVFFYFSFLYLWREKRKI